MSEPRDRRAGKPRSDALIFAVILVGVAVATVFHMTRRSLHMSAAGSSKAAEVRSYAVDYGLALVLTLAAFAFVRWQVLAGTTTLVIVLVLAFLQMLAHFRFFLHITLQKSTRDDLQLILFSV